MAKELFAGRVDAIVTLTAAPLPAIQEAESKEPIASIRLSPEPKIPDSLVPTN